MNSKQLGGLGEKIAERYLKRKGYKILDRNFSKRFASGYLEGEIDLIAKKGGLISFVEVKTLARESAFSPEQKVNLRKRRKIAKLAEIWLQNHKIPFNTRWEIDVISIIIGSKGARIKHFQNIRLT